MLIKNSYGSVNNSKFSTAELACLRQSQTVLARKFTIIHGANTQLIICNQKIKI